MVLSRFTNIYNYMKINFKLVNYYIDFSLNDLNIFTFIFEYAEYYTGISRVVWFLTFYVLLVMSFIMKYTGELTCTAAICVYPAFMSLYAVEYEEIEEHSRLLVFWIIFAIFVLLQHAMRNILNKLIYYWCLKFLLFTWLYCSWLNSSSRYLYYNIIRPFYRKSIGNQKKVVDSKIKASIFVRRSTQMNLFKTRKSFKVMKNIARNKSDAMTAPKFVGEDESD
ncbi:receptor expression-enhancing protein 5-like [Centruroides vittatus]|uniref:receptor expression-enhancing protein 5-like n=1 Tax=Centruroides vittatus TaxID=120091 RepID=UPI0035107D25